LKAFEFTLVADLSGKRFVWWRIWSEQGSGLVDLARRVCNYFDLSGLDF